MHAWHEYFYILVCLYCLSHVEWVGEEGSLEICHPLSLWPAVDGWALSSCGAQREPGSAGLPVKAALSPHSKLPRQTAPHQRANIYPASASSTHHHTKRRLTSCRVSPPLSSELQICILVLFQVHFSSLGWECSQPVCPHLPYLITEWLHFTPGVVLADRFWVVFVFLWCIAARWVESCLLISVQISGNLGCSVMLLVLKWIWRSWLV